jgi:hypothetical protein
VREQAAEDRVADVEPERGAEERGDGQVGRHESETGQHADGSDEAHRFDASQRGSIYFGVRVEREDTHILRRLYGLGEDALGRLAAELLANPRVAEAFATALRKAMETKGRVDRNVQTVLALLNLPSRADVHRLLGKLEAVQGSLVNLNLKVDRLLAEHPPRRAARKPRVAPASDRAAE